MLNLKIKKLVLLLLIFNIQLLVAQSGGASGTASTVPNQTPPTPEAFKFAQYGEIPVNESSGNATVDIPLFTYKVGSINVPMSMSHSGGAVKVDAANTWTGINWQLNVGGLISRTVNDLPDENVPAVNRIFHTSVQLHNFVVNESQELADLTALTVDSEVDIFNYSFPGYSGSFYLDENLVPRLIKYDKELKIELSANAIVNGVTTQDKKTLILTTPDGTKYYFGGVTASESTRIRSGGGDFSRFAQTGFYLFKIENILGDIVTFNYEMGGNSWEIVGYSERFTVDTEITPCPGGTPPKTTHLSGPNESYLETLGKVKLINIVSNRDSSKMVFESSLQSSNLNRFVLNNILIYDSKLALHKKIVFDYITPNTINTIYKRFYLEKIKIFEGTNTITDNIHSFEYNTPELLPDRFSKAQDHAGYYNGKTYNNTYLPKTNNPFYASYQSGWADKSVNFGTTLYGSLKKVTYPTKGYTEFEYETGIDNSQTVFELVNRYANIYRVGTNPSLNRQSHTVDSFAEFDDTGNPLTILNPSQPINVRITGQVNGSTTQHDKIKFTLHNTNAPASADLYKIYDLPYNASQEILINDYLEYDAIPPGSYTFKLEYYNTLSSVPQFTFNATAHITFSSSIEVIKHKPGIRIKNVRSYTAEGSAPLVTRYYYNKAAKRLSPTDSQYQVRTPNYEGDSMVRNLCNQPNSSGMSIGSYNIYQKYIQSNTQNNIYDSGSGSSMYEYVTVSYGGDNFVKGGKETHYLVQADNPLNTLTFMEGDYASLQKESNNSLKNGTVLKEIYFSANPSFDVSTAITSGKLKEITNTYKVMPDKDHQIVSCLVSQVHAIGDIILSTPPALYVGNYYYGYYYTYSWWHTLEKTETKEYFVNGTINSNTDYYYDSKLAGLPSRIVNTLNDVTPSVKETKYYYPMDLPAESFMSSLIATHRILPVRTVHSKDGVVLFEEKTIFGNNADTGNRVLPKNVYSAKFPNVNPALNGIGQLERKITYDKYDANGMLVQYTPTNGIPVTFIWGYKGALPIAKIENAVYADVASQLNNLQNLSDTGTESDLLTALTALRNSLPNAMISTYTHKPLVGVSTVTDPKGERTYYTYDVMNRLQYVKDAQGNILSSNEYHYKN